MARARNIKPSFFQNEQLGELNPIDRLAFIGMWTIADYKGCIEFRPKRLKIQLMPYDNCDMELIAINLDKSGLIRLYSINNVRYIKIINFEKHQNPHKNERDAGSDIPDYLEESIEINELQNIQINPDKNGSDRADSLFPLTDSLKPITESKNNSGDESPEFLNCVADEKSKPSSKQVAFNAREFLASNGATFKYIDDWFKVRKTKKAANTETAMKMFCKEVEKSGILIDQALEMCIVGNWQSFKADWVKGKVIPPAKVEDGRPPSPNPDWVWRYEKWMPKSIASTLAAATWESEEERNKRLAREGSQ